MGGHDGHEAGDLDPHDGSLLTTTLALTPGQRLQRLIDYVRFVEAGRAAMRGATARQG